MTDPFVYEVQLQNMRTGESKKVLYPVRWDPEKVSADEVGTACRIEETVKHGFDEAHQPREPWLNISAKLQKRTTVKSK
jgi:hypothetical protein